MPVSALIVNYRTYDDLDRALSSLAASLSPADEIIVVDQESDPSALGRLAGAHPRARFLPVERNLGFAAGINLAARHAGTPHLLWLNPDAAVAMGAVSTLERWLTAHPDTGVVGPRVLNEDGTVQASARRFPGPSAAFAGRSTWLSRRFPGNVLSRRNLPGRDRDMPMRVDWVAGSCLMTPRALFERLGGLDETFFMYWEDADYCRRVTAVGLQCIYLPAAIVTHTGGRSAAGDPAPAIRAFHRSAYRLYLKHAGLAARTVAPLVRLALWARGELAVRAAARVRTSASSGRPR